MIKMIIVTLLILSSLSSVGALQICPTVPVDGEAIDILVCRNVDDGDNYWNETVKFIQVNFIEDHCESFYEDVYLSDSRLVRIKTKTIYMPSKAFYRPSCLPKEAIYLLNGLFYVPSRVERPPRPDYDTHYAANRLAMKICSNYRRFVTRGNAHSVEETRKFIRNVYGSDSVTGYILNGEIYFVNCEQIPRGDVIYSKQIRGYCYEKIPVIINNNTILFTTIGIDLESRSIGEECKSLFQKNESLWENTLFLRYTVVLLVGMLIFLILIDLVGIVFLINESRKNKDNDLDYNDFLFKLANESIKKKNHSEGFDSTLGFYDDCSANVNVNLNGNNNIDSCLRLPDKKENDCIQFHQVPPRPHPFDAILSSPDAISLTSTRV